ncbi:MAG: hypothetical protein ACRD2M_09360, partial [Terriglobales bacterium]
ADTQAAMLQVAGAVRVNGHLVDRSAAVFHGDRIATGKDGVTSLIAPGVSIHLVPDSQLTFEGTQVSLVAGGAQFRAGKTLSVRAGRLTIAPVAAGARFEVLHQSGQIRVAAMEGNLTIRDGKQTTMLEAGKELTAGSLPSVPKVKNSAAAGVVIGLLLAAGLAVGLGLALRDDTVSPEIP